MRVKLILPYYGKWPAYLSHYLESCRPNERFEFHFFTDLRPPSSYPSNVTFTALPFGELIERIRRVTQADVPAGIAPYKLCDFKPMYGVIFSEYLQGTDFWGHGDVDVIYGDIARFITPEVLAAHDVISCHHRWMSGAFALFRNSPAITGLYKKSPYHRTVPEHKEYLGFDETLGHAAWDEPSDLFDIEPRESMTHVVLRARLKGEIRAFFADMVHEEFLGKREYFVWENGTLKSGEGREKMLFHFVQNKERAYFAVPERVAGAKKFYITETGLYLEPEFRGRGYVLRAAARKTGAFARCLFRFLSLRKKTRNSFRYFMTSVGLLSTARRAAARVRSWHPRQLVHRARVARFYSQFVGKGDLCFDVGANVGDRTDVFDALGARTVAVEPQPACVAELRERFAHRPRVVIEPFALSDTEGTAKIWIDEGAPILSTLSDDFRRSGRFSGANPWSSKCSVRVTTLDKLIEKHGMPKFCKIDVEGFEAKVFAGLSRAIPSLSFEYMRELAADVEGCARKLSAMGDYEFNFCEGESFVYSFKKWQDRDALFAALATIPKPLLWGDVYARLKRSPSDTRLG